jgi:hypothetical protein
MKLGVLASSRRRISSCAYPLVLVRTTLTRVQDEPTRFRLTTRTPSHSPRFDANLLRTCAGTSTWRPEPSRRASPLAHIVTVSRAPHLLALWLMRHKVCIDPGVRALPSSATLSLRRGSRFLSSRSKAYPRPYSSESRQTVRVHPRPELSSHPAQGIAGAISAQAKADAIVSINTAAPEQRRIRPAAYHSSELPLLQLLDRAIIVLPGAMLYLAQAVLMARPHRSLPPGPREAPST